MRGKVKIGLNMLLMIIVLGVIFYVMDNSLSDIFAQLMETSWLVLIAVIFFGVVYQFAEGRSIKEIARYFNKDFTTVDGFFYFLLCSILSDYFIWHGNLAFRNLFL